MTKMYSFNFHYNKPASLAYGKNMLTVHYRGVCHIVEGIDCKVPIKTKNRNTQPRCVMVGKGILTIKDNIAIIEGINDSIRKN